ncbi:MAG: acyl carrier protein [Candidatus Melainabacteria bacterium 35_41]|nr:MAG: acyl carrier protein [Candidatus Melainabacteria bacterium 35_41]CDE89655.1 acyl carrier protein 2 [Clostridium sp. CAG:729]
MFEAAIRINTVKKYTRDEIFDKLKSILVEDFEIEEEKIQAETNLFEDLELDSIDAVDLAVKLQGFTQKKIPPENFKQIRTINDVVLAVEELL